MNRPAVFKHAVIASLILLLAAPSGVLGQETGATTGFGREELSQMLAPIALYPDSLLANVLVAATFPLEVVAADRWVKQNKDLKGNQVNAVLDKMKWDLSVKALAPFPDVLAMMSDKLEWTQTLGEAFLAQQTDVMDTVQKLRAKAQAEGYLKTTQEQKVEVKGQAIVIEPASPTTIYVPAYNPTVVYGAWPYPAYPPYSYYPAGAAVTAGIFGFAAGVAVGAAWNNGWGRWNWGGGSVNVNVNRNININGNRVSHHQTTNWNQAARRGSVATRDSVAARRGGSAAEGGRDFRGSAQTRPASGGAGRPSQRPAQGASARPTAGSVRQGLQPGRSGGAFQGVGNGGGARMSSDRGRASRQESSAGLRGQGAGRGGKGGSGGGRQGSVSRGGGRK